MAAVTAAMVKELRERTGLGMMECKKALVEADGDIEKAIDDLRKSGQAKAAKKAGRTAAEGAVVVASSDDNTRAVMVEINSETDFVARDDNFLGFCEKVAGAALAADEVDAAKIGELKLEEGATVEEARQALVQKIGENIQVRRAVRLNATDGLVGSYVHGGKIGVLVALSGGGDAELAKDVSMHVAAVAPMVVKSDQVPEDVLDKEREIIRAQPDMEGKPAEIVEKMLGGRINKFLKEVSLNDQPFVKDPNTTVGKLVQDAGAEVVAFERLVVGEGIEKEEVDFAAEVMAQAKQ
ncbi:translation elongation factor Ts [Alloalcanivorax sp. C16-2]|uniref:translation elongation factor Ts n=1 Tax=Alloalcanivorax TaxID=3020832 RepID=UPI001933E0FE|nr:translation elongation factor Ts [Alloalcanivorax marinus]MBL7249168.1 elongation factor Ts [Alloalcanivorax marinus]